MRHCAVLYMCLLLGIVQSTPEQTNINTTVSPVTASTHDISQTMTNSNITTNSSTHITSPSPNLKSQSSLITSPHPTITQPTFTKPVVTTSTMAKPLLTPSSNPDSFDHSHGSASAQFVDFGFLLISLMSLVIVDL
ncbi:mucin-2-like [Carassius carassius]|uniref:mucin-2-like n=1 Tax=Carassius carassius TaxID=217509 RepID=UPI0028684E59|nr:mucin-2-like [Carassius carassius]